MRPYIGGMDVYTTLCEQARDKRDKAIRAARDDYKRTLAELTKLSHTIVERGIKRPPGERNIRRAGGRPFNELTVSEAVEVVLRDSQMMLTELTLEI